MMTDDENEKENWEEYKAKINQKLARLIEHDVLLSKDCKAKLLRKIQTKLPKPPKKGV